MVGWYLIREGWHLTSNTGIPGICTVTKVEVDAMTGCCPKCGFPCRHSYDTRVG